VAAAVLKTGPEKGPLMVGRRVFVEKKKGGGRNRFGTGPSTEDNEG